MDRLFTNVFNFFFGWIIRGTVAVFVIYVCFIAPFVLAFSNQTQCYGCDPNWLPTGYWSNGHYKPYPKNHNPYAHPYTSDPVYEAK
jgi:hypothetical protein